MVLSIINYSLSYYPAYTYIPIIQCRLLQRQAQSQIPRTAPAYAQLHTARMLMFMTAASISTLRYIRVTTSFILFTYYKDINMTGRQETL